MTGVKGFNMDLSAAWGRKFHFAPGRTYEEGECKVCRNGFHFVEYAPDCLGYHPLDGKSRYFRIEASGDINEEQGFRACCTRITLVRELDLKGFAGMAVEYMVINPRMGWEREAKNLQIRKDFAGARNSGAIAIARGADPAVQLCRGSVGGLICEGAGGILAARVFRADVDGLYTLLPDGKVRVMAS